MDRISRGTLRHLLPPASGTDVYRVTSLPKFKGPLLGTVIFVEFESRNR